MLCMVLNPVFANDPDAPDINVEDNALSSDEQNDEITDDEDQDKESSFKERKKHKKKKEKKVNHASLRPGQDSDKDIILELDEKLIDN